MTAAHDSLASERNTTELLNRRNSSFWTVLRMLSFSFKRTRVAGSCTRSCDSYQCHRRASSHSALSPRQLRKAITADGDYCAPAPEGETPTTISVPPSNWISFLAPSRMLEASAILGSCCPGALFATKTPGIEVVLIAICPVLATTVPGAGLPLAGPPAAGAALLALLPSLAARLVLGLADPPV